MPPAVFITGSTDGLGKHTATSLLAAGHRVIVHARSKPRLVAVADLIERGAIGVVGDLADIEQVRDLASQVNALGPLRAVIHNAGVLRGPTLLAVNVVAPYLLTTLIDRPERLVYLSSSMHEGGRARLEGIDRGGENPSVTYSDTKLLVTTLSAAVARRWPDVVTNAVDPGWVPTRMGGPGAPGDLGLGHLTQEWLATSSDAEALTSGGYWHHQTRLRPHRAVADIRFQNALLESLAALTGEYLT